MQLTYHFLWQLWVLFWYRCYGLFCFLSFMISQMLPCTARSCSLKSNLHLSLNLWKAQEKSQRYQDELRKVHIILKLSRIYFAGTFHVWVCIFQLWSFPSKLWMTLAYHNAKGHAGWLKYAHAHFRAVAGLFCTKSAFEHVLGYQPQVDDLPLPIPLFLMIFIKDYAAINKYMYLYSQIKIH